MNVTFRYVQLTTLHCRGFITTEQFQEMWSDYQLWRKLYHGC